MEELARLLNGIDDSYYDFVSAILSYARKKTSRLEILLNFLKENPNAMSSDVVEFVSNQPDFMEDSSDMNVG